jgi:hypothetical protein
MHTPVRLIWERRENHALRKRRGKTAQRLFQHPVFGGANCIRNEALRRVPWPGIRCRETLHLEQAGESIRAGRPRGGDVPRFPKSLDTRLSTEQGKTEAIPGEFFRLLRLLGVDT